MCIAHTHEPNPGEPWDAVGPIVVVGPTLSAHRILQLSARGEQAAVRKFFFEKECISVKIIIRINRITYHYVLYIFFVLIYFVYSFLLPLPSLHCYHIFIYVVERRMLKGWMIKIRTRNPTQPTTITHKYNTFLEREKFDRPVKKLKIIWFFYY